MKKKDTIKITSDDNINGSTKSSPQNFEDILENLGGFGKFQGFILVGLLILEIPTAFVTFIPIFVGKKPESWQCSNGIIEEAIGDFNFSITNPDVCHCNESSNTDTSTIVSEWNLICDSAWVSDFITSIQMLGMFFGNTLACQFADWYGRKYGFLLTSCLLGLGSAVSAVAPNPYVYAVARLFCGAGIAGYINITSMASMEFVPPKWRSVTSSIGPTGEGIMILSIIAYFIRPWRSLHWATTAPFLLAVLIYPILPESPRWLLRNQRFEEAHKVFAFIARVNGAKAVEMTDLIRIGQKERQNSQESQTSAKKIGYLDFFKDPTLRKTTLFLCAIWFAWSTTYYGVGYNIKNVKGNIYVNVFFMGVVNTVGQKISILFNNRIGRRKSLFISMTFCAVSLVALAISELVLDTKLYPTLVVTLSLLGVLGISSSRAVARLLSGESFPTAVRTMGLGIGGVAANCGGVLTPQLALLGSRWPSIPYFVFAAVSVGGSLVSFLMTETAGKPLEDEPTGNNTKHSSAIVVQTQTAGNKDVP